MSDSRTFDDQKPAPPTEQACLCNDEAPALPDKPPADVKPVEGEPLNGDWVATASSKLYLATESALKTAGFSKTKESLLPDMLMFDDLLGWEESISNPVHQKQIVSAGNEVTSYFWDRTRSGGLSSFWLADSILLQSGTKPGSNDGRGDIFERGRPTDPFKSGSKSDLFSNHGFSFRTIGATIGDLMGFRTPVLAGAGAVLDAGANSVLKNDKFNFDGMLNSDFMRSSKDTKAGIITSMGFDKVSSSLSDFFFSSRTSEKTADTSAEFKPVDKPSGLLGSIVDSVKNVVGNTVIEGSRDLLKYIFGDSSEKPAKPVEKPSEVSERGTTRKNPDGSVSYDGRTPDGGRLHVDSTDTGIHVDSTTHGKIDGGKGDGPQPVRVQTIDGRDFQQHPDGRREAGSQHSDLKVEQQGDRVLIKDKNGHQVAEFGSAGDAKRFLDNGEITMARPGETVEDAASRLQQEQGQRWNGNNHIITDGQGNVLTVDENGNTLRRYPDGRVDMSYRRTGTDGQQSQVNVRILQRSGRTVVLMRGNDGEYRDTAQMTDAQVRGQLQGSDLSWVGQQLHRRCCHRRQGRRAQESPVGPEAPPTAGPNPVAETPPTDTQPVVGPGGQIQATDNTTVDASTGKVQVRQGDNVITVQADPTTGRTALTESESGRIITQDANGGLTVQGREQEDRITYDPHSGILDAWGIRMGRDGTDIGNPDGSRTHVDRKGNFELFDHCGQSLLRAFDNALSFFDGTEIDSYNKFLNRIEEEMAKEKQELAKQEALHEAALASSLAAAIAGCSGGVLEPGAIGALLGKIQEAAGMCLALNVPIPGELMVAEAQLLAAIPKFNFQVELQDRIKSQLGHVNNALITFALDSGSGGTTAVAYANRLYTGHDTQAA